MRKIKVTYSIWMLFLAAMMLLAAWYLSSTIPIISAAFILGLWTATLLIWKAGDR